MFVQMACHTTALACRRAVLSCLHSRIVFRTFNSYKSARYVSNNSNRNDEASTDNNEMKEKEKTENNQVKEKEKTENNQVKEKEKTENNKMKEKEKTENNKMKKKEAPGYLYKMKDVLKFENTRFVDLTKAPQISVKHIKKETENSMLLRQCLEESPDKEGFVKAVDAYISKNKIRQGHIDFIATAMKFIEPYGLEKEVEVYERLIDVFPRDRFANLTLLDAILPKPHPQMFLALDLLTKMEYQGILPTETIHDIVYEVFGRASMPLKKIYRMWFWFQEYYDINPYKLLDEVYLDRVDIIKAAIDRILGNNDGTKIIEISVPFKDDGMLNYDHFIISSQTLLQKKYISFCNTSNSIYIEGPSHMWINHKLEQYFIMKTGQEELISTPEIKIDSDEEREGVILGVCFATAPYDETLQKWLKYMQEENPLLGDVNIVFNIDDDEARVEKPKVLSG